MFLTVFSFRLILIKVVSYLLIYYYLSKTVGVQGRAILLPNVLEYFFDKRNSAACCIVLPVKSDGTIDGSSDCSVNKALVILSDNVSCVMCNLLDIANTGVNK